MSSEKKNNDYLLEVDHPPGRNTWSGWRVRLWKDNSRPYTASPVSADGR